MKAAVRSAGTPSGAKDQVSRLLTLVPYLHAHGGVRLVDAARTLDVSPEQVLKDLKVLLMCGLPGGYPDDLIDVDLDALESEEGEVHRDGVIRISNADYLDRPLRLTPTEASAMIVALRALRAGAEESTVKIVDRVLVKLESAAADGPAEVPLDASLDEPGRDAELAALAGRLRDAVARQVQVELDYYVPTRDEQSVRTVDPRGVVHHHGFDYLDAWCHSAEAPRLFRLDRISRATVLRAQVVSEPQAPRDLRDGIFSGSDDQTTLVTLRLAPPAQWVVEYYPAEAVRPSKDHLEVDLLVADHRWLTKLLLRLAPNASVVAPVGFTVDFTAAAQDALALYRNGRA
ncbi:MAG: WYL domain-containing protein [Nocardioides sp.]